MRKIANKKIAAVALGAVALTGTGVAYAYWTTSGSGDGAGTTTEGVAGELSFTQNPAGVSDVDVDLAPMFPGDTAQDLTVRVRNTSDEAAYVTNVKVYITTDALAACDGSNFLIDGLEAPSTEATAVALDWTEQDLDQDEAADATGDVQFNNKLTEQDDCKTAGVTLHYVAS